MLQANLNNDPILLDDGLDSIVIVNALGHIPGGRALDVSGVASGTEVLRAGHVIKKAADGTLAPLGVSGGAYVALSSGESYVGVLKASVLVSDPRASVVTIGQVNAAASPYPVTDAIKNGLARIEFLNA